MTQEIALKILWDSCCHNLDTQKAYKVLKNDTRPQGKWIENSLTIEKTLNCSICGARPRQSVYGYYFHDNFCPECGADMRGNTNESSN